jgi:hypothetical protein
MLILPRRFKGQPQNPAPLDLESPILAGVSNAIIMYGDAQAWLQNRAAGGQLGSQIPNPTITGGGVTDYTDIGPALEFDGTSTYLDFGTANIPTVEFTLLWGGVFDANDSPRGFIDCTNNGVSGWNIYQGGGSTMYFNNSSYPAGNPSTGWTPGQFFHGALRNKGGVSCDWFRDGAKIYTGTGVSPAAPTLPLWIGRLKVGGLPYLKARFSYLVLVDRFLSDDTLAKVPANPWIVLQAPRRAYLFAAPATGGTTYNRSVSGSLTPAGSIAKLTGKTVSGSSTATGDVTKQTGKAVGGSATLSGAITRAISKGVAGSITGTGSLVKSTLRAFAGSITPTGNSSTTIVFTQVLAGSMTLAGAIGKMTLKAVTGSSTVSGAVAKLTNKGLSASITVQGAVSRITARALAGAITAAGALSESYAVVKSLAGSITPSGALTAAYIAFVAGVLKLLTMMGIGQ